jgi:hypothetical protein
MSLQAEYAAIRNRLRNPPNAVKDEGIDLRRRFKIVPAPVVVIPFVRPEPILKVGRHNRGWPIHFADAIAWRREPQVSAIVRFVAKCHGISMTDFISDRKTARLVRPRHMAMWLAKEMTTKSLPFIGKRLGGRDHTTILHGVRKIEALRKTDLVLQCQLDQFQSALRSNPVENDNAEDPAAISG